MMKQFKIVEIGPYPPPASGWSVRIKYVKEAFDQAGHDCQILNLGRNRKEKSDKYIDVQGGYDYLKKLILLRFKKYHFHMHMNAQAVKGPILSLLALCVSLLTFEKASLTFHGGIEQLYFPKRNGKRMYLVIYLNFLLAKIIICNNEEIKKHIAAYGPFISKSKVQPIPAFSIQYLNFQEVDFDSNVKHFINTKRFFISCYIILRNGFFIETLIEFLEQMKSNIGIVLVGTREVEDSNLLDQYKQLLRFQKEGKICMVENLARNEFLTLLKRSDLCLRTPVSDGVASSVLEALYLGTPVVASENGRRPSGTITYQAEDGNDLNLKINNTISQLESIKRDLPQPAIRDTVKDELNLLIATHSNNL